MLLYAGFLFSIFLDYVRPGSYLPAIEAARLNSVVPLTILLFTIFHKSDVSHREFFNNRNSRWLLFFFFLLLISVFTSDVTHYSFNVLKTVLGFIFWYYIIVRLVTTERRMRTLFATLVLSHAILLALNPQLVTNPEVRSYIQGNTFLGDGNDYSLSVTIVIPMCLYLIVRAKSFGLRIFWATAMAALMLGVVGTQSRGAAIALAVLFLFLWWKGRRKALGLVLVGIVTAGIVSYAPDVYFDRLNTITNYQQEGSAMGRIMAWKTAVRMAEEYPLLGVGSGHFAVKLGTEFRPPEYGLANLPWLTAHSMYFLLLGELGIPGITFLLALLIGNYISNNNAIRIRTEHTSELSTLFLMLNASLVAFAVGGAFLSVAYYPHLYVLTGIWTAAYLIHRRAQKGRTEASSLTTGEDAEQRAERLVWSAGDPKNLPVNR